MKKIALTLFAAVAAIFIYSCGGGGGVETSPEMKEFLGMMKGSTADVQAALDKFAADSTLKMNDIAMWELKDGKAVKKDGDCYDAEFASGMTTRTYGICWTGGKISKIEDKGMK